VEPPSPLIKTLDTLVKKKPHYKIVLVEEAEPKKKIDGNVGEQNVVIGKRIKKRSKAVDWKSVRRSRMRTLLIEAGSKSPYIYMK